MASPDDAKLPLGHPYSADRGVDLIAPATGKDTKKVGLEECVLDDEFRILECPCGKRPLYKKYDGEKGRAVFAGNVCAKCPAFNRCSASKQGGNYVISYDAKSLRLCERRLYEKTDGFREKSCHNIMQMAKFYNENLLAA